MVARYNDSDPRDVGDVGIAPDTTTQALAGGPTSFQDVRMLTRDYTPVAARVAASCDPAQAATTGDRVARMRIVVDALWDALHDTGVSWAGFYVRVGDTLELGPRRDKPACSPIGLHGACGRTLLSGQPMVVRDVSALGANYIACDPRDRSEVVIPLHDTDRTVWGVLDLDSHEVAAFSSDDVAGLEHVLLAAGLTTHSGAR